MKIRPKKVVLSPEIGEVKTFFITHPPAQSNVCQNTYFKKQTNKQTKSKRNQRIKENISGKLIKKN